jgi:hypothetical protein
MKYLGYTLETYMYSHYNMCNIPIYFCNINIQRLQHISLKLLKHFELYICNMHRIPVQPPPSFSSGCQQGQRASVPGPALLLALAALINERDGGARVASGAAGKARGTAAGATGWAAEQEHQ